MTDPVVATWLAYGHLQDAGLTVKQTDKKWPKLRTRQSITIRYRELELARDYYEQQLKDADLYRRTGGMNIPRFVQEGIKLSLAECNAQLDALRYALNDVV